MSINLSPKPEIVNRPAAHYVYLEKMGPFSEVAPSAWTQFSSMASGIARDQMRGMLGLSIIDRNKSGNEGMIYQAGIALASKPAEIPKGLQYRKIDAGKYARFLLTGPYSQLGDAFSQVFCKLSEESIQLRDDFCVENYLNDPRNTPEAQLLTEILVPVQ